MRDRLRAAALRPLGWLLHLANAHPGASVWSSQFYALKDRLCRRFGTRDGEDVQRIVDLCFGEYDSGGCLARSGGRCYRCRNTGVWRERWILLERWTIGGRTFHRPVGPTRPRAVDYIDGRIRHDDVSFRASQEAFLWLALLFDRPLWWRAMLGSGLGIRSLRPWRPMGLLQAAAYVLRGWWLTVELRRCHCGRRYNQLFRPRGWWTVCRRCAAPDLADFPLATVDDVDLPF